MAAFPGEVSRSRPWRRNPGEARLHFLRLTPDTAVVRIFRRCAVLLACAAWLGACAADWQGDQPSLLATQTAKAENPATHRRLFYIGLALWPEQWSQNDVVDLAETLRATSSFEVVPLIASDFIADGPRTYPVADDAAIADLVRTAAEHAGPDDLVFVHVSTHGGPGVLARKIEGGPQDIVRASWLARLLAPLGAHHTVIVLSACYSGSLIGSLESRDRIIMTAARADRSSFGCAAMSRHTFFGDAELRGFGTRGRSLHQVFIVIGDEVAAMEQAEHYGPPSEPQVSVGAGVKELYDSPVF